MPTRKNASDLHPTQWIARSSGWQDACFVLVFRCAFMAAQAPRIRLVVPNVTLLPVRDVAVALSPNAHAVRGDILASNVCSLHFVAVFWRMWCALQLAFLHFRCPDWQTLQQGVRFAWLFGSALLLSVSMLFGNQRIHHECGWRSSAGHVLRSLQFGFWICCYGSLFLVIP